MATESSLAKTFGKIIKSKREKNGLSQVKLAFLAEIDPNYISQIERGLKNVSLPFVWKLAKALNLKPSELVGAVEKKWQL